MAAAASQRKRRSAPPPITGRTTSTRGAASKHRSSRNHLQHEPLIVQHNYHDHSGEDASSSSQPSLTSVSPARLAANGVHVTFPIKLFDLLSRVEETGQSHIISWQPHGRCFVVHNPKLFTEILPTYFGQSKITSFHRQLNLYGFLRLTSPNTPDRGGYYHECFLRGMPHLLARIARSKVKGTGCRSRSNPSQEPNFWNMSWVGVGDAINKTSSSCLSAEDQAQQSVLVEPQGQAEEMVSSSVGAVAAAPPQSVPKSLFRRSVKPLPKVSRSVSADEPAAVAPQSMDCGIPSSSSFSDFSAMTSSSSKLSPQDDLLLSSFGKGLMDLTTTAEESIFAPDDILSSPEDVLDDLMRDTQLNGSINNVVPAQTTVAAAAGSCQTTSSSLDFQLEQLISSSPSVLDVAFAAV